ncbi:Hypothetical protein Bdt_2928 [Bdellovibrio bacteriovorus str. Tiberius]|uniref:Uncharacterized protein n=1 Tax=Bdellovibrio bacteriovorus str. Tiberius TaxID=1069642 RepID=K7YY42_BDEBC|nr:Hypothetical protein Bdt_2928 [Bdellovibrio bacteriovorus str. Tiberius]
MSTLIFVHGNSWEDEPIINAIPDYVKIIPAASKIVFHVLR